MDILGNAERACFKCRAHATAHNTDWAEPKEDRYGQKADYEVAGIIQEMI